MEEHIVYHEVVQRENIDDCDAVGDAGSFPYGENNCHICAETFTCLDNLCDHSQSSHEEYYVLFKNPKSCTSLMFDSKKLLIVSKISP